MVLTSSQPPSSCKTCGKEASCKVARTIADLEGVFKQLISLKFLIASAHWACADVLDRHSGGAHQPTATSTAPPALGTFLWFFATSSTQTHIRKHNSLITNVLKQRWVVKCFLTTGYKITSKEPSLFSCGKFAARHPILQISRVVPLIIRPHFFKNQRPRKTGK